MDYQPGYGWFGTKKGRRCFSNETRRSVFVFKPSDLLFELIDKKYVDADVKNWRKDNKKEKKVEISDELLGF